jgi:hypothetical protein
MQFAIRTFRKSGSPRSAGTTPEAVARRGCVVLRVLVLNLAEVYCFGAIPPRVNRLPAFHSIQPYDRESTTAFFWASICGAS